MRRMLLMLVMAIFGPLNSKAIENSMNPKRALSFSELPEQACSIVSDNLQLSAESGKEDHQLEKQKNINSETMVKLINSYGERTENSLYCTATVVSGRELITAGHCMMELSQKSLVIKCAGKPPIKLDPKNVKTHEEYGEPNRFSNDIAVITLDQPLGIRPARIVQSIGELEQLKKINKCFIAGYGNTQEVRNFGTLAGTKKDMNLLKPLSLAKLKSFLELQNRNQKAFVLNNFFSDDRFGSEIIGFVEPEGTNMRKGDSGGGLYCRDDSDNLYLVGVNSAIIPKWDPVLEVFRDVSFFKSWLDKNLALDPPTIAELIQTKRSQIAYYCGRAQECQNILGEHGILLTFDVTQILEKMALEKRSPAQQGTNEELLKSLDELKKSYIDFIAKCYDALKKRLSVQI